jgi:membrane-bound serine protease (ClpP class)
MKKFAALMLMGAVTGLVDVHSISGGDIEGTKPGIYVIPIRDEVATPLSYLVRRGVKEAMDAGADLIILDMDTNGGRLDATEEIIEILGQFRGQTVTLVNRKAFSAGAFIAVATQRIFMTEGSVIGAAAPVLLSPGGGGIESVPETFEAKITSGVSALVRASAEKNGHNVQVVEAMIDRNKSLVVDGEVLNEKGQILTLTNRQAEKKYGTPPRALLSEGTVKGLEELLEALGRRGDRVVRVDPLGAERIAGWLNAISPILLIIGIVGLYIEFKTPGFGLPGMVGLGAFALYFLGGYVAGLAGLEWAVVFIIGLVLVILELLVFTGTAIPALVGAALMLTAVVMAMVDVYPGMPAWPGLPRLRVPVQDLVIALAGAAVLIGILGRLLPRTRLYGIMVSQSASGEGSVKTQQERQQIQVGRVGTAVSQLRPGGKAQFDGDILDVITQGELMPKGTKVKIIGHSGTEAIVSAVGDPVESR